MTTNTVFISHAHDDADVAVALKELIEDAFGALSVFVSSDSRSLAPGAQWFQIIEDSMSRADLFIAVLSPVSITRPWVNFEAGAAFGRRKNLIPVCVRGLNPNQVGAPLNSYQLLLVKDAKDLEVLLERIGQLQQHRMKVNASLIDRAYQLAKPRTDDLLPPLTAEAERNEPKFLDEMHAELDALTMQRKTFWEALDRVYASIATGKPGYPANLNGLVDSSDPPKGIPVKPGEDIRDFPTKYARLLQGPCALLWDFCVRVYPAKVVDSTLAKCSAVDTQGFDAFHEARALHAKLWNRYATKIYELGVVSLKSTTRRFAALRRLVNLLTYLELALDQCTQDPGEGKSFLFRLNRDWDHALRQP